MATKVAAPPPPPSHTPHVLCTVCVGSEEEEEACYSRSLRVCSLCQSKGKGNLVVCEGCNAPTHTTCLGLGPHAYPGGFFQCAQCVLLSAHLEVGQASLHAQENAHMLVWLRAKRVTDSSQATYASGLHRYVRYAQEVLLLSPESVPPKAIKALCKSMWSSL